MEIVGREVVHDAQSNMQPGNGKNTNLLMRSDKSSYYYAYATGAKTGSTTQAVLSGGMRVHDRDES